MTSTLTIFLCFLVLNTILWIFFFIAFKKKYSGEKILSGIKSELSLSESRLVETAADFMDQCDGKRRELERCMKRVDEKLKYLNEHEADFIKERMVLQQLSPTTQLQQRISKREQNAVQRQMSAYEKAANNPPVDDDSVKVMIDESLFSRQPQVITSGTDILSEPSDSEKILRLADRGLSSEEIVSRLGIPLFQVEFILNAQKMST
ncbi:MAG: hypothetical protein IIW10_04825 [Spirochaetaceae bacterium]|nr:hypothetical protein [Spirochaetaceae bacterium]